MLRKGRNLCRSLAKRSGAGTRGFGGNITTAGADVDAAGAKLSAGGAAASGATAGTLMLSSNAENLSFRDWTATVKAARCCHSSSIEGASLVGSDIRMADLYCCGVGNVRPTAEGLSTVVKSKLEH